MPLDAPRPSCGFQMLAHVGKDAFRRPCDILYYSLHIQVRSDVIFLISTSSTVEQHLEERLSVDLWVASGSDKERKSPRYSLSVVDIPACETKNGKFAVFIVPEGEINYQQCIYYVHYTGAHFNTVFAPVLQRLCDIVHHVGLCKPCDVTFASLGMWEWVGLTFHRTTSHSYVSIKPILAYYSTWQKDSVHLHFKDV